MPFVNQIKGQLHMRTNREIGSLHSVLGQKRRLKINMFLREMFKPSRTASIFKDGSGSIGITVLETDYGLLQIDFSQPVASGYSQPTK